jgi:hypothetical protein
MKKAWLFVVLVVGLAAVLNGCCNKQCPSCTAVPSAQAGMGSGFDASQMGSGSASRSIK